MNYIELEKFLKSPISYANISDENVFDRFKQKYDIVPFQNDIMFVFHHAREFQNRDHIISLHKRNGGTVPMHIFHYIVMTYVYSGTFVMSVEDEKIILNKGDIIILDKHVPHRVEKTSSEDLGINIILSDDYFSKRFINHLPDNQLISQFLLELMNRQKTHNHYLVFYTNEDHLIDNCFQNILCEHFDMTTSSHELIDNYIMILITHLARLKQYNTNLTTSLFKNHQLMNDILHYIKNHYKDGNLNTMCKIFGYDPSYTSKLVKQFAGKTFKQLVNEERMKNASILLHNQDIPIYEVASKIGINNLTSFYKRFYEYAQCTPLDYRNNLSLSKKFKNL